MRPVTPLPGFNVATAPRSRYCGNHVGGKVLAVEPFDARLYCAACAYELRAYSRAKPCSDETPTASIQFQPEGVAAVRTWAL